MFRRLILFMYRRVCICVVYVWYMYVSSYAQLQYIPATFCGTAIQKPYKANMMSSTFVNMH